MEPTSNGRHPHGSGPTGLRVYTTSLADGCWRTFETVLRGLSSSSIVERMAEVIRQWGVHVELVGCEGVFQNQPSRVKELTR